MDKICGAYAEHWEELGKPKGWLGCSLPEGHSGDHSDCVPVEPAQPELPKELPLLTEDEYKQVLVSRGFPEVCAILDADELAVLQAQVNKSYPDYQNALDRIKELEAVALDGCQKSNPCLWLAEIASLKEQLAVFTKDIPKGRFCYMANSIYCEHESGGDCVLLQEALVWDKNKDAYLKAPGCPVPAKEEQ